MGITDFGKQLRPREHSTVDHVERIQSLFSGFKLPQEMVYCRFLS